MKPFPVFLIAAMLLGFWPRMAIAQQNTFTRVFYDPGWSGTLLGYSVIETPDSGFLLAGEHNSLPMLLKMNKSGQMLWEKVYDPGYNGSFFTRIIPTADEQLMVVGSSDYTPSGNNILCIKMTPAGDTLWSRSYDFGYKDMLSWIEQTSDQGFVISSYADYPTPAPRQAMILKLQSNGDTAWSRRLTAGSTSTVAHVAREMPDGGYMVAGSFRNEGNSYDQALMIRLSASGNVEWARTITNPNTYGSSIYDVRMMDTSLVWLMLNFHDYILFYTDMTGNFDWGKDLNLYGVRGMYNAQMPKLHPTYDNGLVIVSSGQFGSAVKTDSTGTAEWGAEVYLESIDVIPVSDSGYLFLGNGPLWGVDLALTDNPQTGLIKTDALGQTDDCLYTGSHETVSVQFAFEPVTIQVSSGVTSASFHPEISTLTVETWNGCVAMTGSINDRQENDLHLLLSPNPSAGTVTLTMEPETVSPVTIRVFDATGTQVYQTATEISLPASLDLSHLPNGIYLIQATSSQFHVSKKLLLNP